MSGSSAAHGPQGLLDAVQPNRDTLDAEVEAAIEWLQEYVTALITGAVTGKIDLR